MSGKFFLDTNVIVYLFDARAPQKKKTAQSLIEAAHTSGNGMVSNQVMQEFTNVATHKFKVPLNFLDLQKFLVTALFPICFVTTDVHLIIRALRIRNNTAYSFYDCLMLASALEAECETFYSEDLQHTQQVEGMTIVNPFV